MKIIRFTTPGLHFQDGYPFRLGVLDGERVVDLTTKDPNTFGSVSGLLRLDDPGAAVTEAMQHAPALPLGQIQWEAPLDVQEVWETDASYPQTHAARMDTASKHGAAGCYETVFNSPRHALCLKSTPERAVGPEQFVRVRADARRSVPEPSLVLVINYTGAIVGYTIANAVVARDLADESPLYVPQASIYRGSCALGPCLTLANAIPDPRTLEIEMRIERDQARVFQGRTSVAQMKRRFEEMAEYLGRENDFVPGVFLLTGAAVVPPAGFTLQPGDIIETEIEPIGVLRNTVE